MIQASPNSLLKKLFDVYLFIQFKKYFNNFYLVGNYPAIEKIDSSILLLPNHFSWWDGFFADFIKRKFFKNYNIYMMILEETLKRYPFFKYFGAFSIDLNHPKSIVVSFEYAKKILTQKNNLLVIFPQGELIPYTTNVEIKNGVEKFLFIDCLDFWVINMAAKIQYSNNKKPDVFFRLSCLKKSKEYCGTQSNLSKDFNKNLSLLEEDIKKQTNLLKIF